MSRLAWTGFDGAPENVDQSRQMMLEIASGSDFNGVERTERPNGCRQISRRRHLRVAYEYGKDGDSTCERCFYFSLHEVILLEEAVPTFWLPLFEPTLADHHHHRMTPGDRSVDMRPEIHADRNAVGIDEERALAELRFEMLLQDRNISIVLAAI